MNDNLKQILDSGRVLEEYIKYLIHYPNDYLDLVKINPELARQYTKAFTADHVLTLFLKSDSLITDMMLYQPKLNAQPYIKSEFTLPRAKEKIDEMINVARSHINAAYNSYYLVISLGNYTVYSYWDRNRIFPQLIKKRDASDLNIEKTNDGLYKLYDKIDKRYLADLDLGLLNNAYQNIIAERQWNEREQQRVQQEQISLNNIISDTAHILLSKLDTYGVLDSHFYEIKFKTFFPKNTETNLFDILLENQQYALIGKVISLLSPQVAMRELQKMRKDNTNLFAKIIQQIPTTRECLISVLDKMTELSTSQFERLMPGFDFDVLERIDEKCKQLARRFYHLAPDFMHRQYPNSVTKITSHDEGIYRLINCSY